MAEKACQVTRLQKSAERLCFNNRFFRKLVGKSQFEGKPGEASSSSWSSGRLMTAVRNFMSFRFSSMLTSPLWKTSEREMGTWNGTQALLPIPSPSTGRPHRSEGAVVEAEDAVHEEELGVAVDPGADEQLHHRPPAQHHLNHPTPPSSRP